MFGKRLLLTLLAVALIAVGAYVALAQSESDTIRIEVAEDGNRFVFGQERLHEDGLPAYGTLLSHRGISTLKARSTAATASCPTAVRSSRIK